MNASDFFRSLLTLYFDTEKLSLKWIVNPKIIFKMKYYFTKNTSLSFEKAIERTTELLKEQGFGIITEIDVTSTFKNKLNLDFRKYRILGACNPAFAHEVLSKDSMIGLLLPCNVVVQEMEDGSTEISAINAKVNMEIAKSDSVADIACKVTEILEKVIQKI